MVEFAVVGENLRHALKAFGRATGTGEIREYPGVTLACAGLAAPLFNTALLVPPELTEPGELDRLVYSAANFFGGYGLPWSLWVCEDLLERSVRRLADQVLTRRGLRPVVRCPGMVADSLPPLPRRPLPEVEFHPVLDAAERLSFCHVMMSSFEMTYETARRLYTPDTLWKNGFAGYVGYAGGNAVATAATVVASRSIGVYAVATLPAWRKRGFGEAVTRHAIEEARRQSGFERSVLQSTHSGLSLYRHMGYREVTHFDVYKAE